MTQRSVVLLGSTGSIGTQALDVIRRNPDRFRVVGLAAGGGRANLLGEQAAEFGVPIVGVGDEDAVEAVRAAAPEVRVHAGVSSATEIASLPCDVVLNGMSGASGLVPTLTALAAGSTLALANKESLIIGGPLVQAAAGPGQIVPVDSEHSALAQCLRGGRHDEVKRLVLTASGGPFRGRDRESLRSVTVADALAHPTWSMGPLVTINSATLVNKGLELIEAHLLFGIPIERIDVVVHPQSVVHSMVEYVDGSTLAQASPPDMRLPIALGLSWPDRVAEAAPGCDWTRAATWTFEPLDDAVFPAVDLARRAAAAGGVAPAVFNAADEVAVGAFLEGRLSFLGIVEIVGQVLGDHLAGTSPAGVRHGNPLTLSDVLDSDAWARGWAHDLIGLRSDTGPQ